MGRLMPHCQVARATFGRNAGVPELVSRSFKLAARVAAFVGGAGETAPAR
jgi:hypothetical protein